MTVVAEDNLAHSLWDRCTLHANGQEIFHTSNYAQMAYMQTLLHKTEDEKTLVWPSKGGYRLLRNLLKILLE